MNAGRFWLCGLLCVIPLVAVFCSGIATRSAFPAQDVDFALTADDPAVRLAAVAALKEQGETAIPSLAKAAHDSDSSVRKAAIRALGEVGGKEAAGKLAELLTDPDRTTRVRAILALGLTGRAGFPYLLQVLESEPFPRARMFAANSIARLVKPGDAQAIVERFDRQDAATQMYLVIALVRIRDDEAYRALNQLIKSPDHLIRFYVVNALADAPPDRRALPILVDSLDDEAVEVRMWGMYALERLNDPASFPAVLAALRDEDPYVRKEAAYTLGTLGNTEAVPFLIASLKDSNPMVRGNAAAALGLLGDPDAAAMLKPLLDEPNPAVQIKTAEALARLGDYSGVETLIEMVDSPLAVNSREAVRALREISNQDFNHDSDAWRDWWVSAQDSLSGGKKHQGNGTSDVNK